MIFQFSLISRACENPALCYNFHRALTRILKTGVPDHSCQKVEVPTYKEYNPLQKIGVPAPKMGVQDCKSAVRESSVFIGHSDLQIRL